MSRRRRGVRAVGHEELAHTPLDPTRRFRIGLKGLVPDGDATREQATVLRKMAVSAFVQAANNGMPFQDCLTVVLNTGMHFAVRFFAERDSRRGRDGGQEKGAGIPGTYRRTPGPSPIRLREDRQHGRLQLGEVRHHRRL